MMAASNLEAIRQGNLSSRPLGSAPQTSSSPQTPKWSNFDAKTQMQAAFLGRSANFKLEHYPNRGPAPYSVRTEYGADVCSLTSRRLLGQDSCRPHAVL